MINDDLIFQDVDGNLVVIMNHVVKRLLPYRQQLFFSRESAGVLIGERRASHLVICDLSEPGPGDIRSRFCVDRKGAHHQEKICAIFAQSGGTQQYIGEWHTHPEDNPTPSSTDQNSWKANIDSTFPMLVLIVGRKKIWVGKKINNNFSQLIPVNSVK